MTHAKRIGAPLLLALVASPAALAAGGGGGGASLIEPAVGTMFWTFVTFLLFAFVLGRYGWKPLLGALDERERSIQGSLDEAKRGREEAERMLAEQRELLEQTRRERAGALADGQRDAEKLKAEILDEARSSREQLLRRTEEQIQGEMQKARAELRGLAVDLAIRGAGKLLERNLDEATQRRLVEDHLRELESGSRPS